jgi:tetratricopeptide (TPR) repeat protein
MTKTFPEICSERAWLDSARAAILRGDLIQAQTDLTHALAAYPDSVDLLRAQAGLLQQCDRFDSAEHILRGLIIRDPADMASAITLASILRQRCRNAEAARLIASCLATPKNLNINDFVIAGCELLDDLNHTHLATIIIEDAISSAQDDARLHAYAAIFAMKLGEFQRARQHYLSALRHDSRSIEWHVANGLANSIHYKDTSHPDFALFHAELLRSDLSELARAELHFALGKAYDDIGDYVCSAQHYREGNAKRRALVRWSAKAWRGLVATKLLACRTDVTAGTTPGFTPIFIVGLPRSGSTLLAELLSSYPLVCNRGELTTLAQLAKQPVLSGSCDIAALRRAAAFYSQRSRQDDEPSSHWFIDKQPLNFRYIDLALSLFPDAKIIHCQRNPRDNALSLWMQCFQENEQTYSYDFDDIALVLHGENRIMSHWIKLWPDAIRSVQYEQLVSNTPAMLESLATWIGIPSGSPTQVWPPSKRVNAISTSSLWQARQPVHVRSVGRWKSYFPYVPELVKIPED